MSIQLLHGGCLELMTAIPDGSVDMILADLPYGTTACKWDSVIPFEPLWAQYRRVCKPDAAIVLTSSQPFTTKLIASNIRQFRYCWVWDKKIAGNPFLAKHQPMKVHEDICVFGGRSYFPVMVRRDTPRIYKDKYGGGEAFNKRGTGEKEYTLHAKYPTTILEFSNAVQKGKVHPTQKPVTLIEYLIRTYTNEGETVLDNTMGSGTTGVACVNTGRNFIGIELDPGYFKVAENRIAEAEERRRIAEMQASLLDALPAAA